MDHLGKFDGKVDEGFFVGYSVVSKAMRVFNKRTRIVEETLNIRFLENAPNMKGNGPDWLFDIDSLTIFMNYEPVVVGKQTNGIAGTKDNIVIGQAEKKKVPKQEYILIPICTTDPLISQGPKDSRVDTRKKATEVDESRVSDNGGQDDQVTRNAFKRLLQQERQTEHINTVEEEVDMNNVVSSYNIPDAPSTKFLKDYPKDQKRRYMSVNLLALKIQTFLTKSTRGQINQTLFIKRHKDDILLVQVYVDDIIYGSTKKKLRLQVQQKSDGIFISQDKCVADILKKFDFSTVKIASTPMEPNKALVKDAVAEDVDVHLYRSMIGSLMYLTASRPDITFAVCVCVRFQVTPKTSHVHDVKRIFRLMITKDGRCFMNKLKIKTANETVYKEWEDIMERAATTTSSLEAKQDSGNINMTQSMAILYEPLPHGTGSGSGPRHLKLEDSDGISTLPNIEIFEPLTLMGYASNSDKLMAMLTVRARRFFQRTKRNLGANGTTSIGFDMSKVECYNCHRRGHFARECRSPTDTKKKDTQRRNVPMETSTSNELVSQCDGVGSYDWSFQVDEEPTNYAFMAFTSSSFSSSVNEDIKLLKLNVMLGDNALVDLRKKLEKAKQERDDDELISSELDVSMPTSLVYDRYKSREGYHAVLPPYTGTFMPLKPDLVFHDAPTINETVPTILNVEPSPTKPTKDESKGKPMPTQKAPNFVQTHEHVKTPRPSVKPVEHSILSEHLRKDIPKSRGHRHSWNRKACFACKSLTHLIKDCDYYEKKMVQKHVRNHAMRANCQHYARMTHPHRHVVPTSVLTRSRFVLLTTARPVTAVVPQTKVHHQRPTKHSVTKAHSPMRRPINLRPSPTHSNFHQIVTTVMATQVNVVQGVKGNWGNPQHALKDKRVIDSGCSRHMTGNISYLSDFKEINGGYVRSQMCDKKNSVLYIDTECIVLSSGFKLPDDHHVLLRVPRENNMYNVDLKNIVSLGDLTCLFARETLDESNLWHRKLGHMNFKTMNKLVKGNLVRGLPSKVFENNHTCVACKKGKQHRASCKSKRVSSVSQPLQRKPNKSQGENIRSDNGTEFKNQDLNQFCGMKGIKREFSVARTSQHNGIAERKNRTLIETDRTMLADSLLPISFWTEAVNTTCYVHNRVVVTKPHNKTPYELLLSRTPSIGFIRPFGCLVTILKTLDPLGIQEHFDANKAEEENVQQYVFFPLWSTGSKDPQNTNADATYEVKEPESEVYVSPSSSAKTKKIMTRLKERLKERVLDAGPSNDAVSLNFELGEKSSYVDPSQYPNDPDMPALEDITYYDDEEDVARQTRSMTRMVKEQGGLTQINDEDFHTCMFACFLSEEPKREEGIDYEEVFAPAARIDAIRLFLAYASFMGFMVYQMDVKNAFLYETIEEEVYVCQPSGFEDPNYPDKVYKVVKALYGLHQSHRAWYDTLVNYLLENGFQRGKIDQTLLIKKEKGLQVKQKQDGIFINQDKYVAEILRKFGLTDEKSASTPIVTEKPLLKDPDGEDVDVHTYRRMHPDRGEGEEITEIDVDEDVTLEEVDAEKDAEETNKAEPAEASAPRRRREVKLKDKGKVILFEEPKPLKRQEQIEEDEAFTRELEAELNANINWNEVIEQVKRKEKQDNTVMRYQSLKRKPITEAHARKNMMVDLKNMAGFKMDFFKATPLALKVLIIDYQIHTEHNKHYYKIIKADGTHQLFLSFISLLRNFDREEFEMLWKIVQERFTSSEPKNFSDDFWLNALKTMFEKPNVEDSICKN
nr:hypothetical protein [Tanacetum cinerariifolium]